jgi:hypothetical protein
VNLGAIGYLETHPTITGNLKTQLSIGQHGKNKFNQSISTANLTVV